MENNIHLEVHEHELDFIASAMIGEIERTSRDLIQHATYLGTLTGSDWDDLEASGQINGVESLTDFYVEQVAHGYVAILSVAVAQDDALGADEAWYAPMAIQHIDRVMSDIEFVDADLTTAIMAQVLKLNRSKADRSRYGGDLVWERQASEAFDHEMGQQRYQPCFSCENTGIVEWSTHDLPRFCDCDHGRLERRDALQQQAEREYRASAQGQGDA